jgi:hypothetical protein
MSDRSFKTINVILFIAFIAFMRGVVWVVMSAYQWFVGLPIKVHVVVLTIVVVTLAYLFLRVVIVDILRRPRKHGLGREVRLNAWNSRTYFTSGLFYDQDFDTGTEYVFYETDEQLEIAQEFFPGAVIARMTPEMKQYWLHPSLGTRGY